MSQIEPMDVDGINNDFDNKENSLRHSNVPWTPCVDKGYEELDVSELNMKLRYSATPANSPLSKSLTSYCLDNRNFNNNDSMNNVVIGENHNLTHSLNSSITRIDTKKPLKSLPLQTLSKDKTSPNRATTVLYSLDSKLEDANVTVTLSGVIDNDENISLPNTPSPVLETQQTTTPTKEVSKHDGGSPILRGLKSVLNMFRSSQSPLPEPENKKIRDSELLSPIDTRNMVDSEPSILASTPITSKQRDSKGSKRNSPLKDSITFNDDLEKDLQWKEDTTILFKEEKIPIHKLFPAHFLPSGSKKSDGVIVDSIIKQKTNTNTSLEYMDISNNESVLLNKSATDVTSELQETLTLESDGEFLDCETTVNYDVYDNRHDNSNISNVIVQCIEPENFPNSCQLAVNNSQVTTLPSPVLEDVNMKNSNSSQLLQQVTDIPKQITEIVVNECNVTKECPQHDNTCTLDKQGVIESENNSFDMHQLKCTYNKIFDNENQNISNNNQFTKAMNSTLEFVAPIVNNSLPNDGFGIGDNLSKDCDEIISPSEVPLPDDDIEPDMTSEMLLVPIVISENTVESPISEKQIILNVVESKLARTESFYKISDDDKDTSSQEVNSENPNILHQQNCDLIQNLCSDNTNSVPELHQIISKEVQQKMSVESNEIDNREKVNETCLKNIPNQIYVTTDQSELLIENVSDCTQKSIICHSSSVLDELECQDLVKTVEPCPQNNCEQSFISSLNVTETPSNHKNVQGPGEIIATGTDTNEDKNLKVLSEDLNELSEQVKARKRTHDMSVNLNNEQENILLNNKVDNLVIALEQVPNVIHEDLYNSQENISSTCSQDTYVHLNNFNKNELESVSTGNILVSNITISEGATQPVYVNNEENCILPNNIKHNEEIQITVLNNCEEPINVSANEKTRLMTNEIKDLEVIHSEKQLFDSLSIDNKMNTEVIKEDLKTVNKPANAEMDPNPPSLAPNNLSKECNVNNNDHPFFTNFKLQNVDFQDVKEYADNIILETDVELNKIIDTDETGQRADHITVLDTTSLMEESPSGPFINSIDQDKIKIENVYRPCAIYSNISTLPSNMNSKAHEIDLENINDHFLAKSGPDSVDLIDKMGLVLSYDTELQNYKEQNSNICDTELITHNVKSLEITQARQEISNISVSDNKANTDKREENHQTIMKELVESPPLSPEISCKGYSFNFDDLEDPFATKTRIRMSPSPDDTFASTSSIKNNSNISNSLYNSVQEQTLHPEHKKQQNYVYEENTNSGILNERNSETKEHEITVSKGEMSTTFVVDVGQVVDNDDVIRNIKINDCQTEEKSDNEKDISVENKQIVEEPCETLTSQVREILLNEDEKSNVSSTQHTHENVNFQIKNVFNLPEMSGVFISKSSACPSSPLALEDVQTEVVHINSFNDKTKDNHDNNVDVVGVSYIASSLSKTLQDAADGDINTEDEDTIEGPFFESEEFSNVDKITEQDDMIKFTDTSTREINGNVDNGEMFIDAEAFDFLLNQNKSNVVTDSGKESLFLKFDPLFAKRMSSDGVLSALKDVKRRQSTPKKIWRTSTVDMTCDKTPSGPFNTNISTEVHNTLETSFEDPNVTVSKPMMVVNPAVNACSSPRNKSCTPPRVNRRSLTFTSPAIAVIDRLLSLNGNNSPLGHESTNINVCREPNEADLALTQLRELLAEKEIHVQTLRTESKELKNRLSTLESQVKKLESESEQKLRKINELNESLVEKTKINKSMTVVLEEYERTMASLIAEIEQDKKRHAEERTRLKNERDEQTAHLASMELAFNDLHSKYEKSKQVIMSCKANEDTYRRSIEEFQENLLNMQKNYESLKQHASSQLNHANREFERLKRAHEAEILKLNAMVKRKEVDICSLEETLAQKIKTNEELAAICDDLINKVG